MSRKLQGYIDKTSLDFTNIQSYKKALHAQDLWSEEIAYQAVFNRGLSKQLTMEIFQKNLKGVRVDTVYRKVISKSNDCFSNAVVTTNNNLKDSIKFNSKRSNSTSYITKGIENPNPEEISSLNIILKEIIVSCNSMQIHILAFILITHRLDNEYTGGIEELSIALQTLYDNKITSQLLLYRFLGKRYRVDKEWAKLIKLISIHMKG